MRKSPVYPQWGLFLETRFTVYNRKYRLQNFSIYSTT